VSHLVHLFIYIYLWYCQPIQMFTFNNVRKKIFDELTTWSAVHVYGRPRIRTITCAPSALCRDKNSCVSRLLPLKHFVTTNKNNLDLNKININTVSQQSAAQQLYLMSFVITSCHDWCLPARCCMWILVTLCLFNTGKSASWLASWLLHLIYTYLTPENI